MSYVFGKLLTKAFQKIWCAPFFGHHRIMVVCWMGTHFGCVEWGPKKLLPIQHTPTIRWQVATEIFRLPKRAWGGWIVFQKLYYMGPFFGNGKISITFQHTPIVRWQHKCFGRWKGWGLVLSFWGKKKSSPNFGWPKNFGHHRMVWPKEFQFPFNGKGALHGNRNFSISQKGMGWRAWQ